MAGVPLPTALRQCGSVKQDFHCPQPPGGVAVCYTAHCPLPTTTVQQGTHRWCSAYAGCSGQMRPCVTARRRQQGTVGQVRECTGPAMPQHTYTQRAHNTHSPARLPLPVGRHPGLCLLVTAPSAPHGTAPTHPTPPPAARRGPDSGPESVEHGPTPPAVLTPPLPLPYTTAPRRCAPAQPHTAAPLRGPPLLHPCTAPRCRAHARPHLAPLCIPTLLHPCAARRCGAPARLRAAAPLHSPRCCANARPHATAPARSPHCLAPAQPHAAPLGSHIQHLCAAPRCCAPVQPHTAPRRSRTLLSPCAAPRRTHTRPHDAPLRSLPPLRRRSLRPCAAPRCCAPAQPHAAPLHVPTLPPGAPGLLRAAPLRSSTLLRPCGAPRYTPAQRRTAPLYSHTLRPSAPPCRCAPTQPPHHCAAPHSCSAQPHAAAPLRSSAPRPYAAP